MELRFGKKPIGLLQLIFPEVKTPEADFSPETDAAARTIQSWYWDHRLRRSQTFFAAAEFGLILTLKRFAKTKNFDINARNMYDICNLKRPALHIAAGAGMTEAVRFLLDNGASALVLDEKGMTALHYASQNTPEALNKMQSDASSNAWKQSYVTGEPPAGCLEIARMLVRRQPKSVESVNYDGQTALHLACSHGLHTVATVLLCEGDADPDIRDGMNRCALHLSAWRGDYEVTRVLLEHSEESEALYARNAIGRTPLHVAAVYGHTRVAKLLLEAGAPHDVINNNGNTPLHLSLLDGFWETADLLLDYGAETHLPNCNGETAIWIAVEKKQSQLALKMLDKRRIVHNSVGLFGYSTEITYDMRSLNSTPERVNSGIVVPGIGELHPLSARGVEKARAEYTARRGSTIIAPSSASQRNGESLASNDSVSSMSSSHYFKTSPGKRGSISSPRAPSAFVGGFPRDLQASTPGLPPFFNKDFPSPQASPSSSPRANFLATFSLIAVLASKFKRKKRDTGSATPTARRKGSLRQVGLALEQTALRRIAETNNKEIISHPVIVRLLEWQWQKFARRVHVRHLLQQIFFTLLWTTCTLIGGGPWGTSPDYDVPKFHASEIGAQGGGLQVVFTVLMLLTMICMFGVVIKREMSALALELGSRMSFGDDVSFSRGVLKAFLLKHDFWFVYDIVLFGVGTFLVIISEIRSLTKSGDCKSCWEMSRVVYGVVSVLVWARFLQFFSSDRRTGPFIKVIAVMFQKDIRNFFTIYFVVLLAFSHGFFILLTGLVSNKIDADQYATTAFDNPVKTVMAVYRLMLGDYQSMYERYETIPSDAVVISTTIMYFAYMTFANVLMLNLLIAMLDETYTEHKREMEKEWRLQWAKRILTIEDSLALDEDHRVPDYIEVTKDDLASEMKHQAKSALEQRMSGIEENLMQTNALLKAVLNRMDVREEREREMALVGRRSSLVIPSEQAHPTMATFSRGPRSVKSHTSRKSSASRQTNSMVKTPVSSNPAEVSYNGSSGSLFALALEEIERSNRIGVMESFAGVEPHTDDPISRYLEDQMLAQRVLETNEALADLEKDMQMENMDDLVAGIEESGGRGPPPFMLPGTAF